MTDGIKGKSPADLEKKSDQTVVSSETHEIGTVSERLEQFKSENFEFFYYHHDGQPLDVINEKFGSWDKDALKNLFKDGLADKSSGDAAYIGLQCFSFVRSDGENPFENPVANFGRELIESLKSEIEQAFLNKTISATQMMHLYDDLRHSGTLEQKALAMDFYKKHAGDVIDELLPKGSLSGTDIKQESEKDEDARFKKIKQALSLFDKLPESEVKKNMELLDKDAIKDFLRRGLGEPETAEIVHDLIRDFIHFDPIPRADDKKPYDNAVSDFGRELIESMQPDIEKATVEGRLPVKKTMDLYEYLSFWGTQKQKELGISCLQMHNKDIIEKLETDEYPTYAYYAKTILRFGKGDEALTANLERIAREAEEKKEYEKFYSMVGVLCYGFLNDNPPEKISENKIFADICKTFDLPPEIIKDWIESTGHGMLDEVMVKNFLTIKGMEESKPGVCKFLRQEFGISDFGRYPPELLLKQAEEFGNVDKPYGLVVLPKRDWNGAFYNSDMNVFRDLHRELNGEVLLRFSECEGRKDVVRTLMNMDNRYNPADGSGHKISLLVLGGHGNPNSIQFGSDDRHHVIHTKDLAGKRGRRTKQMGQFFDNNATIILDSCSTGAEGGIGQELSKNLGVTVLAPKEPTAVPAIHAHKEAGHNDFTFSVEYEKKDIKAQYKGGEAN